MPIGIGIGISVGASAQARGGAVVPFSPADISGLQLWLDATTGLFDATSGGSPVTADGSAVARWEDQSGNGNHATQSDSASRPILKTSIQNSKNILRFDGSNDRFLSSLSYHTERTTFAVCKIENTTAAWRGLIAFNASGETGSTMYIIQQSGATNNIIAGGRPAGVYEFNYSIQPGTTYLLISQINKPNGSSGRINKQSAGGVSHSLLNPANVTETRIGGGRIVAGERWYGDIAEIISYSTELSLDNIEKVENYLYDKWAIS